MLDISFLNQPNMYGGLEFLDFQKNTMFQDLVTALNNNIEFNSKGDKAVIDDAVSDRIVKIIEENTGFSNVSIHLQPGGNLAIDAGYFSPRNIFNGEYIDDFYPKSQTTLGRWFAQNKNKVFKGDIDYKTGKVSGSYATLPWNIYINSNPQDFVAMDKLASFKVGLAEVIAAALCHEVGHAFSVLMAMHQTMFDNFIIQAAIRSLAETTKEKDRAVILKDAKQLLELDDDDEKETIEKIVNGGDNTVTFFYFNKKVNDRNTNRALSVGVKEMTAEVVADMYAVRMGCGRELVAGLGNMTVRGKRQIKSLAKFASMVYFILTTLMIFTANIFVGILSLPMIVINSVIVYLGLRVLFFILGWLGEMTPGTYNTTYRRFIDINNQMILQLKTDKDMSNNEKLNAIANAEEVLKMAEAAKPFFEDTIVQRFFGSLMTLGKFKYANFEHYTQNLINHRVNILSEKFKLGV